MAISLDDAVKVRDLETKYNLELTDTVVIEDNDGTKTTPVSSFKSVISAGLFYNTVEDMKAASFREGEIVYTLGYHSPNDGGGAMYVIKYDPAAMEDNALIHYLYTSDTLRAELVLNDLSSINVLQFGVYGDGSHDDTIAFNNAIKSGYQLYIPKREYKLGNPLMPISNSILDFNGSTLLSSSIEPAISIALNSERSDIVICNAVIKCRNGISVYEDASNIEIKNIHIVPDDTYNTIGITIYGVPCNVNIHDTVIGLPTNFTDETTIMTGIRVELGAASSSTYRTNVLNISNCIIYATQYGILIQGSGHQDQIIIHDCTFIGKRATEHHDSHAGLLVLSNAISVQVSRCIFRRFMTAINITGTAQSEVATCDIAVIESGMMYSLGSNKSTLSLFGYQKYIGIGVRETMVYIFGLVHGKLRLYTDITASAEKSNYHVMWTDPHDPGATGEIFDFVDPTYTTTIIDDGYFDVNTMILTTIRNTTIRYGGNKNISAIANGIKNQIITLTVDRNINVLASNSITLKSGSSFALNSSNSITLKNTGSKWVQI